MALPVSVRLGDRSGALSETPSPVAGTEATQGELVWIDR